MVATIHENYCPAGCPDGATTTTTIHAEEGSARRTAFGPSVLSGSPRSILPPPGLEPDIIIGGVESEIQIVTGKFWRQYQAKRNEVMVQNLDKNPTIICIDSGAGESVCPVDFFPDYEMHQTEKVGNLYRAAGDRS